MAVSSAGHSAAAAPAVASASISSVASRSSALRSCSSRMAKPGGTPASSGKRCSSRSQKAWMVCTLRPPGRLDGDGEQLRAPAASRAGVGARSSSSASLRFELARRRVTHSRQRVEHALRHLGGGRLGVGERQDALGRRAGQQQAQHAHGQHVRLAGAGVGADPGRGARDRRRPPGCAASASQRAVALLLGLGREEMPIAHASSIGLDRPFGHAGQMRVVVVAIVEARPPQRAIGRRPRRRRRRSGA